MLSGIIRGKATSCCFLGIRTDIARGRYGAASDWAGFYATTIERLRETVRARSAFWPYDVDLAVLPHDADVLHRLIRELAAKQAGEHKALTEAEAEIDRPRLIVLKL
jgi:hypothetical protein